MVASVSRWSTGRLAFEATDAPVPKGEGESGARSRPEWPAGAGRPEVELVDPSGDLTDVASQDRATIGAEAVRHRQSFRHEVFFWQDAAEFTDHLVRFVRDGHAAGELVLVLVTSEHAQWLRDALGTQSAGFDFVDITRLGRNPARILPIIQEFMAARDGRPAPAVVEPVWPGRRTEEIVECQLHEALLNVAVALDVPFWLICAYDEGSLDPASIEAAQRSHPVIARPHSYQGSGCYGGYPISAMRFSVPLHDSSPDNAARLAAGGLPELEYDDERSLNPAELPAAVRVVILAGARAGLASDQILRLGHAIRVLIAAIVGRDGSTVLVRTADTSTAMVVDTWK